MTTRRPPTAPAEELLCAICGFQARDHRQFGPHVAQRHKMKLRAYYEKYDKHSCRMCGKPIAFQADRRTTLLRECCSATCRGLTMRGNGHPNYRGGHYNPDGYHRISVFTYPESVRSILNPMSVGNGQILAHRAEMAVKLGRTLRPGETVHHINGIRGDNRPENLELRVGPHGKGVVIANGICPCCRRAYD